MDIPVNALTDRAREQKEMDRRAINDMIYVYHSKMFINEKNYTMRLIENLHKLRYYRNIETIFRDKQK